MNLLDHTRDAHGLAPGLGACTAAGPAAASPGTRPGWLDGLVHAFRTWHRRAHDRHERRRRYRRTVAELCALDDHALADIGVRRVDIPALAAGLAHRPRR